MYKIYRNIIGSGSKSLIIGNIFTKIFHFAEGPAKIPVPCLVEVDLYSIGGRRCNSCCSCINTRGRFSEYYTGEIPYVVKSAYIHFIPKEYIGVIPDIADQVK